MENRIHEMYFILRRRLTKKEILKIAESTNTIFKSTLKPKYLERKDQKAISVYFKLYSAMNNNELREFLENGY